MQILKPRFLSMNALVGAFNKMKALEEAFSESMSLSNTSGHSVTRV